MDIRGYLQTSLNEWPGKISAVVWVSGCNFRCPFCDNRDLILHPEKLPQLSKKKILADLKKRKKWIDAVALSIYGDEPVVIKKRGKLLHLPIRKIWNYGKKRVISQNPILHEEKGLDGIECLTKNDFQKASKILRHKTGSLYKIVCGPGNYSLFTTGSHSVFTVTKKGLVAKRVDRLEKGMWLLSLRKINADKNMRQIPVLDYVSCLNEKWLVEDGFIHHKNSKCKVPIKVKLSSELGEFLGYAVAEGSVKRRSNKNISSYTFTFGDEPILAERTLRLYRKIFHQQSGVVRKKQAATGNWQYDVIIGNRIIGELISNLTGDGFANKHVPQIIFNAPTDVKITFLKALILGDGHERIRKTWSQHELSLKTGSKRLAADVIFLLKTTGIFSWIEEDGKYFRVVVSQNDLEKLRVNSQLDLKYRFRTKVEGIPRKLLSYGLRGQKRIGKEELAIWKTLPAVKNKKRKAAAIRHGLLNRKGKVTEKGRRLLSLLKLSEGWDFKEIRRVERIELDSPEYVYDLVVEGNHSFVGGVGSLLLHNTGGEPTLQPDLPDFLEKIKELGFLAMIETNGTKPEVLKKLFKRKLLDRISLDVKSAFEDYPQITKSQIPISKIKESIRLILGSGIDFEFRTTVVPTLHTKKSLIKLAKQLKGFSQEVAWFLQQFVPQNCLDPSFEKIKPYRVKEMKEILVAVRKYIPGAKLRGV